MAEALPASTGGPRLLWLALLGLWALLARYWLFGGGRTGEAIVEVADGYGPRILVFAAALGALVLLHGARRFGLRRLAIAIALVYTVALAVELLGVEAAWPFGRYSFAPDFPAQLFGRVPAIVPWLWFCLTYLGFATTEAMLGRPAADPSMATAARRALVTAVLLVAYDLVADPNNVFRGGWSFEAGGPYHGVPLQNFGGWLLLGWVLALALHRFAAVSSNATRREDLVVALAYALVLAHESLFALRIAALPASAAVGFLEVLALIAVVPDLRRGVRRVWTSLRPGEAMRGAVFVLAGFLLGQPSPLAPEFDVAGFWLCLLAGIAGAGAVLAYNSYEGRGYDLINQRHRNHPLVAGEIGSGQQLAVAGVAAAVSIACFAAYRPASAWLALGGLGAGALYSAERLRGKERSGLPTLLHVAGSLLFVWAGAGPGIAAPTTLAAAAVLAVLFVAGHFQHAAMDHEADRAAGIHTVAVRHGLRFATTCSIVLFAAFYLMVAVFWVRGWWPLEMAAPFLVGSVPHFVAFAAVRPWRNVVAAQRYATIYRLLFVACAGLALLGWWSREPVSPTL